MKTEFDLEVRTRIPVDQFKVLQSVAKKHDTTVAALVAELVRRQLARPVRAPRGRPSPYTSVLGEQVLEGRRFQRSFVEIGAEMHISPGTAQRWLQRFEAEQRTTVTRQRTTTALAADAKVRGNA